MTTPVSLGAYSLGSYNHVNQEAETLLYILGFFLIVPAALIAGSRSADAIARGPNAQAISGLSAALVASLAGMTIALRLLPGRGNLHYVLVFAGVWSIAASAAIYRASRHRPWNVLAFSTRHATLAWIIGLGLTFLAVICFVRLDSVSVPPMLLMVCVAGATLYVFEYRQWRLPSLQPRWGRLADTGVVLLILVLAPNLVIVHAALGPAAQLLDSAVIQFHHGFWLGPTNELLAGRALLVDNAAQYGVGSIYFLAGWFQLAPIGYGTLGFLDGALFAFAFGAGYLLLRLAAVPRWLAAATLGVGIVVLIYNLVYPVGTIPQHGPLRFGLPLALIGAAVWEGRRVRAPRFAKWAQFGVLGLAAVWSFEAFVYTLATFAGILACQAWLHQKYCRRRIIVVKMRLGRVRLGCSQRSIDCADRYIHEPHPRLWTVLRLPPRILGRRGIKVYL